MLYLFQTLDDQLRSPRSDALAKVGLYQRLDPKLNFKKITQTFCLSLS